MDFYRNLPAPLRIGIPVGVGLILLVVVYMTMFTKPAPVEVVKSQDIGVFKAAMEVLTQANVTFLQETDPAKGIFILTVAENEKVQAATALKASGIEDRSGNAKTVECPAAPGFTGTKAQNDRVNNCEAAKRVQVMLLTAGAVAANVSVSQSEGETLLGPDKVTSIMAQVFLPPTMANWNAEEAAAAMAASVDGATIDRIVITDDRLQTLFNGAESGGSTVAGGAARSNIDAAGSTAACNEMGTATEIATKEAAVSACFEGRIKSKLDKILGSSEYSVLSVAATVDPTQRTISSERNTRGPITSRSAQSGGGSDVVDEESPPNSRTEQSIDPAGEISKLNVDVALDATHVNSQQQLAVSRMLSTFINSARKDPAPTITRYAFPKGTGGTPSNEEFKALKAQAASTALTNPDTSGTMQTKRETPGMMLALMVVLVIGIFTAVAVLWRRSQRMSAERAKYESEFRNQQAVLDTYAQQDPAALAADLERMFGAPSAPEPNYR